MNKPELHFYELANNVVAFSSTRHSGVSKGNYAAFNINRYCGDSPDAIEQNRKSLANCLEIDVNKLIVPHQIHSDSSRIIANEYFKLPANIREQIIEGVDAVMTNELNVCIGVSTADCIPILLYDTKHHAAAAIHAGWRGTVKHIVQKTIKEMGIVYQTKPQELQAVIGPGISLQNFEVGDEVYEQFANACFDMERIARRFRVMQPKEEELPLKWHLDLKLSNRIDMETMGVLPQNIIDEGICTYDNTNDYFSARKLGVDSGRIYNGIILK
ncbi:peptidoglycan editing factor PgeF [Prevotella pallens]|uniref:peptidoglycan editing factor PgeF n=1 Tax=Prevotella pallens TaxID=60133 RepID=UPI0028D2275F|nr:peptidoglycan editing factor PgeF [Prevotella pallens]